MWNGAKSIIKSTSGLNDVVLHILLGSAIFIILAVTLRRPLLAFFLTAIIQVVNEIIDLVEDATGTGIAGSIADVFWTLLLPVVLLALFGFVHSVRRRSFEWMTQRKLTSGVHALRSGLASRSRRGWPGSSE
jgi:hypothetical protein